MFSSPEYKRSRRAYISECTFEYFVTIMIADSFLAKLLSSLGMSDSLIGIISSFISLAFLFQLFSIPVVKKITNTKKFCALFHTAGQLCFMLLYLIPFFCLGEKLNLFLACALILLGYFGNYFVNTTLFRWGNSFVRSEKRASFSAMKEMITLLTSVIVQFIAGIAVDHYVGLGNQNGAFLFIAISIFVFSALDLVSLLLIKNEVKVKEEAVEKAPFREVLKNTLGIKNFRRTVILACLVKAAQYSVTGFLGIYKVNDLLISMTLIQIINISGCLCRFGASMPLGKFSDKTSFARGVQLGMSFIGVSFFVLIFTSPSTWWLIIPHSILYHVGIAGTNSNMMNIAYSYVDSKYVAEALALINAISGLVGFAASLISSFLLSSIQQNGFSLFGIELYGQQVLAAIAFTISLIAFLFVQFVIGKQKVQKQ